MSTETNIAETGDHLFTDSDLVLYREATLGQRFLNFLIDNFAMQYGLAYLTGLLLAYVLMAVAPETASLLFSDEESVQMLLTGYAICIFNYLIYYTFCEKVFRVYTLGKLITGTRAVKEDGGELTLRDAFLRTLSRIVPFEPFSAFGNNPWHDSWTKTMVVKSR
jgi:uncharacterized RDD family membrane protein YckC